MEVIMDNSKELLRMENITKIYSNGFIANKGISFDVKKGEIHALIGENGAGKTTLMKILFGLEDHQEGKIYIEGEEVHIANPLDAIGKGIGMVHQHFMQVPNLTIAENVILGMETGQGPIFDKKKAVEETKNTRAYETERAAKEHHTGRNNRRRRCRDNGRQHRLEAHSAGQSLHRHARNTDRRPHLYSLGHRQRCNRCSLRGVA